MRNTINGNIHDNDMIKCGALCWSQRNADKG